MKRLFIAVNIYPSPALLNVYNELRARCNKGKIKWVHAQLFHLTLKFLGETDEKNLYKITQVLNKVSKSSESFNFDLKGLGIFGSSYRPRIIRVNISNEKKLIQLGNHLRQELEKSGFTGDRQNFVPHLTLGRIKQVQDKVYFQKTLNLFKEVYFQRVEVREIFLYESILHRDGPEYMVVDKYKLL